MEWLECNAHLGFQLLDLVLALEVPDLDGGAGGRAQPVPVRREAQRVDGVCKISYYWLERSIMLGLGLCYVASVQGDTSKRQKISVDLGLGSS